MKCKICGADVTYVDSHQHTTNLRNHIQNYHRHKLETSQPPKVAKIDDFFREKPTRLPTLPLMDRQAIAACCSAHVLSFELVEDQYFQWEYNPSCKDREKIHSESQIWRQNGGKEYYLDFPGNL